MLFQSVIRGHSSPTPHPLPPFPVKPQYKKVFLFSSVWQLGDKTRMSKMAADVWSATPLLFSLDASRPFPAPGGDKLPSPSIKHPCSCSSWDPWTTAWAVSHLVSCWYHSNDSLAKINQLFWKALYSLLRCVTDVGQTRLRLSERKVAPMGARVPAGSVQINMEQWWALSFHFDSSNHKNAHFWVQFCGALIFYYFTRE